MAALESAATGLRAVITQTLRSDTQSSRVDYIVPYPDRIADYRDIDVGARCRHRCKRRTGRSRGRAAIDGRQLWWDIRAVDVVVGESGIIGEIVPDPSLVNIDSLEMQYRGTHITGDFFRQVTFL